MKKATKAPGLVALRNAAVKAIGSHSGLSDATLVAALTATREAMAAGVTGSEIADGLKAAYGKGSPATVSRYAIAGTLVAHSFADTYAAGHDTVPGLARKIGEASDKGRDETMAEWAYRVVVRVGGASTGSKLWTKVLSESDSAAGLAHLSALFTTGEDTDDDADDDTNEGTDDDTNEGTDEGNEGKASTPTDRLAGLRGLLASLPPADLDDDTLATVVDMVTPYLAEAKMRVAAREERARRNGTR